MRLTPLSFNKKTLKECMLIGVTRLGRLHNLTMLTSGKPYDKRKNRHAHSAAANSLF